MKPYLKVDESGVGELYIYGDIVDDEWYETDVSSFGVVKQLQELNATEIHVYINSYGGSVSAGLAIYNNLKRHQAKIVTYCDGFACSVASVIFMAGDERVMSNASLLMIHNPWMYTCGNANKLRKDAEDLEKIGNTTTKTYLDNCELSIEEVQGMLDDEMWVNPQEALDYGFATSIAGTVQAKYTQSLRKNISQMVFGSEQTKPEPQQTNPKRSQNDSETTKQLANEKVLRLMSAFFYAFKAKEI